MLELLQRRVVSCGRLADAKTAGSHCIERRKATGWRDDGGGKERRKISQAFLLSGS